MTEVASELPEGRREPFQNGNRLPGMLDPGTEEIKIIFTIMHNVVIALTEGVLREEMPKM